MGPSPSTAFLVLLLTLLGIRHLMHTPPETQF
jgi:hypothetical protein